MDDGEHAERQLGFSLGNYVSLAPPRRHRIHHAPGNVRRTRDTVVGTAGGTV